MQKHDWIAEEQQYFGQPNSAYDFSHNDPKETARQISKLQVGSCVLHIRRGVSTEIDSSKRLFAILKYNYVLMEIRSINFLNFNKSSYCDQ